MPWVSKAQRAWGHATKQSFAKEFDAATPKGKKLPKHVGKSTGDRAKTSKKI